MLSNYIKRKIRKYLECEFITIDTTTHKQYCRVPDYYTFNNSLKKYSYWKNPYFCGILNSIIGWFHIKVYRADLEKYNFTKNEINNIFKESATNCSGTFKNMTIGVKYKVILSNMDTYTSYANECFCYDNKEFAKDKSLSYFYSALEITKCNYGKYTIGINGHQYN